MNIIILFPNTNDAEIDLINNYYIIINKLFDNTPYQSEFDIVSNSITTTFITEFNKKFPNILSIGNSIQLFKTPVLILNDDDPKYIIDKVFDIYDVNINNCLISNTLFQYDEYFYYEYNLTKECINSININKIAVSAKLGNISALYIIRKFIALNSDKNTKILNNILYFIDMKIEEYINKYTIYYPISVILGYDKDIEYLTEKYIDIIMSDVDLNLDFRIFVKYDNFINIKQSKILYKKGYPYSMLNQEFWFSKMNMLLLGINGITIGFYRFFENYNLSNDQLQLLKNFDPKYVQNDKLNMEYIITLDKYLGPEMYKKLNTYAIIELVELKYDKYLTIVQLFNTLKYYDIKKMVYYFNLDEASKKILYNGNYFSNSKHEYFWDKVEEIYSKNKDRNDVIEFVNTVYGIYTKCNNNLFFKLKPFDPISNILIDYENIQDDGNGSCYDNSTILNNIIKDKTIRNATLNVFKGIIRDQTLSDDEKEQQIKKLSEIVTTLIFTEQKKDRDNLIETVAIGVVTALTLILIELYNIYKK